MHRREVLMKHDNTRNRFPTLIHEFFCNYLMAQRNMSAQTVASYRDTFRLLLAFAQTRFNKCPSKLNLEDIDAPLILAFLEHLEKVRGNLARTRNARLAAIRSFCKQAALREPVFLPNAQQILAIPMKRFDKPLLGFLSRQEMDAIMNAPDKSTWNGHRDHVMFSTFYNTGARVSEIIALSTGDVILGDHSFVTIHGKGRKERSVPLWKSTAKLIRGWLNRAGPSPASHVFTNRRGLPLTRSGIEQRLRVAVGKATAKCGSLEGKKISVHTLRHTTAMHLLESGVDIATIALWLGHESLSTTHSYIEANLQMKQRALEKLDEPKNTPGRFRPTDKVLAFLDSL
ncbi:MAG: site-specific integrase [Acidobacteria bacterium]|nr:site-specific integrase [Acidobacteriota bacterium]